ASADCTCAISASSSATRAACSGVRSAAGVKSAPSAASSTIGWGLRARSRTSTAAAGLMAFSRAVSASARRVELAPWLRALALICRVFIFVSPYPVDGPGAPESMERVYLFQSGDIRRSIGYHWSMRGTIGAAQGSAADGLPDANDLLLFACVMEAG